MRYWDSSLDSSTVGHSRYDDKFAFRSLQLSPCVFINRAFASFPWEMPLFICLADIESSQSDDAALDWPFTHIILQSTSSEKHNSSQPVSAALTRFSCQSSTHLPSTYQTQTESPRLRRLALFIPARPSPSRRHTTVRSTLSQLSPFVRSIPSTAINISMSEYVRVTRF